jgi:hypothetical protein
MTGPLGRRLQQPVPISKSAKTCGLANLPGYVRETLTENQGRPYALRIGAEGLMTRPAGPLRALLGVQANIREQDVEWLRSAYREDLPDAPLVWDVALRTLVARLLAVP